MVFIIYLLISSSCIASNEMVMCSEMFDSGEVVAMANLKVLFSHYCKMTDGTLSGVQTADLCDDSGLTC